MSPGVGRRPGAHAVTGVGLGRCGTAWVLLVA
ncbi:molecular chaperone, partial [Pseudomonas aeruginosa]